MNRREFLKLGLVSVALGGGCRTVFGGKKPVALQLWSINKLMWKEDPAATFAKIREWGFFGVPPDDGGALVPWEDVIAAVEADPSFRWYVIECERKPDSYVPPQKNLEFLKVRI